MWHWFFQVIKAVVPAKYLDDRTIYHLQPSGRFVIGGPQVSITRRSSNNCIFSFVFASFLFLFAHQGDAGVTGRKIIVDTYGGWGAHGGGAFSGKDFSKVDRSAAYAARWVAKSLVKAKLCRRVLVQVSRRLLKPWVKQRACADEYSLCYCRCLTLLECPSLCPSHCSPTVLQRKLSQSCCRLSTGTLIYDQEWLSGNSWIQPVSCVSFPCDYSIFQEAAEWQTEK